MSKPEAETHPELVNNNNNPCLDLFYNVGEEDVHDPAVMEASCNYVKQVLPLAWSHNPLTALKLICNLLDGKCNLSAFYTAAFWLHHNHPKTLGVVPHMVFWTLSKYNPEKPVAPRTQPGVSILSGFSNNLLKHFLDNEGEIGPDYLMELAFSDERYQALTVVD